MLFINTTEQLQSFCDILANQPFITVDSEFIREHTYYPKLCLIQVAYEDDAAIIDPLSDIDLKPFFAVLQNPNVVKVFHAGRQDIEIFYNLSGQIPQNIFDTQIAAMVCGFVENIGYGNLVCEIEHIDLDKSCRLTDWSKRPLDDNQLQYAACDVTHLVTCYKYLKNYMDEHQRQDWVKEETEALCDEKCYHVEPAEAWRRVKHNIYSQNFLSALKYLAEWRETRAIEHNIPRSSILKDDVLLNLACSFPKSVDDLRTVRNLKSDVINGKLGTEIIDALEKAKQTPLSMEICKADRKLHNHVPNHEQSLMEVLKLLLKICSQEAGVISRLIADDDDLRYIIINQMHNTHAMQGWRFEIFGKYAEKLCRGELSIAYNPKKKRIEIKESD